LPIPALRAGLFFPCSLLSQELPNLQELKNTFNETLLENEKFVRNKIDEFNKALK
jgi:hypothetical protein